MRNIKCIIIFLLFPVIVPAQEIFTQPEATFITKFPFRLYSGGVMTVKAKFQNTPDSLNFILDTGSGGISLDSATCSHYNIPVRQSDTTITGIGGTRKVAFAFNKSLHFPGLTINNLNFHINDYEVLSSVYGEKIDGIIGYSFFSRYIVKLDFDSLQLHVLTPGKITYPSRGTTLRPVFTSLPIQFMRVRDKRKVDYNFYIDTGAGLSFLMSDKFASDSNIISPKRKIFVTQAEGMMGRLEMRLTVVKEVKIGPYRFFNVPTYLYNDSFNVTSYPFAGGLIGNELLRRFNMTINYPQREIHLLPNKFFNEGFDYTYTGLGIYSIDKKVLVIDVIPGSPAALAGFQIDDEVVSIENNFSGDIQQYKNLLQVPDQKLKLIINREGALHELFLKTKSIL